MSNSIIVVPCFNEAARLDANAFRAFVASHRDATLLFVDDGSRDKTLELLESLKQFDPARIGVLPLPRNSGKAEAVRHGLLEACKAKPTYVGFWDADLATPLDDVAVFMRILDDRPEIQMVFGSRVHLLGRSVRRKLSRHYLGRLFATVAAFAMGLGVYDTQCGAKLFRVSEGFVDRLQEPFIGGWIFDVEMIAREIRARRGTDLPPVSSVIYEHPLLVWRDVAGSKIRPIDWFKVGINLGRIYFKYLV
jgi:glycosyltransferase involved in cell wall biosynthesis